MPSDSWRKWNTTRAAKLAEIEAAHRSMGGDERGRRYATEQINHAYAVLLASQSQGFCRDLHSECVYCIVQANKPRNQVRRALLESLNTWRNAIAHQDFDTSKLGGTTTLHLKQVRRWRKACIGLAKSFDAVMREHIKHLTGAAPW